MLNKIILNIVSFLLTITLFLLLSLIVLKETILNKNYILDSIEQNNYYQLTYYNIKDTLKSYTIESGVEDSIIDELCNELKVKKDINMVIDSIYNNQKLILDKSSMKNKLSLIIEERIKDNNRIPTNEELEAIQIFVNTILKEYENNIIYNNNAVLKIQSFYHKMNNIIPKIMNILFIINLILLLIIIILSKSIKKVFKLISIPFFANSFLFITLNLFFTNKFKNILIINLHFSKLLISIINNFFVLYFYISIILFIIGLIFNMLGIKVRKKILI